MAKWKADTEFDKYKERSLNALSPVEAHFLESFDKEQEKLRKQATSRQRKVK
ncbi:MAG: hypothetical protein LUC86_03235 [Prevotellaceae bacterium]|nr:hypothetical protein [Prevotellaceae bacterium]